MEQKFLHFQTELHNECCEILAGDAEDILIMYHDTRQLHLESYASHERSSWSGCVACHLGRLSGSTEIGH